MQCLPNVQLAMLAKRATTLVGKHFNQLKVSIFGFNSAKFCTRSKTSKNSAEKPKNITKNIIYCNTQIANYGKKGNVKGAESIFNSLQYKTTVSWTAMLTVYANNRYIDKARKVFDEMPERTIASYNAMITGYIRNGCRIAEACELFESMEERNEVSYGVMISGFLRAGRVDKAERLYSEVPVELRDPGCSNVLIDGYLKKGRLEEAVRVFEGTRKRDVMSWSSMVDGYCKRGMVAEAREVFDRMPERNVVSWSAMINGYIKKENFEDGFGLFLEMRREGVVEVNATTFSIMFEACGNLSRYRQGIQVHGLVSRLGYVSDMFLGNSMINMYCRVGCLNAAKQIFDMMVKKDVVAWNSLIAAYVEIGDIEEAYELFEKFPGKDVVSWTTMISGFSSQGQINKSIELFNKMPEKDVVAWTSVVSGFVNNEYYREAFHWYIEMLREEIRPNTLTLSIMLAASAGLATLNQGLQIHAQVLKMDIASDLYTQNSLVSMYSKCGSVAEAHQVFREIKGPNIVSFNSMIAGFAQNGLGVEAFELFQEMISNGQEPNPVTFLIILSACAHMGFVEKGWSYFKSMKSLYHIEPEPDHYACMVDLLGRCGLLDEAMDLISSMPYEPHSGVWGALLSASKTHMRADLAELAAQYLFELEPDSAAPYVGLSNLYSAAGEKNDEDLVRMMKKSKGIKKSPGSSLLC